MLQDFSCPPARVFSEHDAIRGMHASSPEMKLVSSLAHGASERSVSATPQRGGAKARPAATTRHSSAVPILSTAATAHWLDAAPRRAGRTRHRTDRMRHRTDRMRHRTDRMRHRAGRMRLRTDRMRHRTARMWHRTDRMRHRTGRMRDRVDAKRSIGCRNRQEFDEKSPDDARLAQHWSLFSRNPDNHNRISCRSR